MSVICKRYMVRRSLIQRRRVGRVDVKQPAVFLDKDGTLIKDQPFRREESRTVLLPRVAEGLLTLQRHGFALVVVTNQGNVAKGLITETDVAWMERQLRDRLSSFNVALAGFYFCPHHPLGSVSPFTTICACRKPLPGLLLGAAEELTLDLKRSWMVGDILHDVEAGRAAGCRTVLIDNGNETEWDLDSMRSPDHVAKDLVEAASFIVCTQSAESGRAM